MEEKIGIFIDECGGQVSEIININELVEFCKKQEGVAEVRVHRLWFSEDGLEELKKIVREKKFTHIVVAGSSPKQHEITFQRAISSAGMNPYLMQMVNLREQIAWVTKDKIEATQKAIVQLNASIKRVKLQVPLDQSEIECNTDFLVIGSGIAGMTAALTLAQKNRKVYLVEKDPWIGGKVVAYEEVFPNLECAPCMLEPKMDEIMHDKNIVLLTHSDIVNVKGFFGNFEVEINKKSRFIDAEKCIACAACYDACPVKVKNKYDGNLSERHAVYSKFAGALPNLPVIDKKTCLRFTKKEDCRKCQESCPFMAVDYEQKDETIHVNVGAIVVAAGFDLYNLSGMKNLSTENPNVYDAYQFERILSSTGPTGGKILNTNGQVPSSIAFVHCAGSRDKKYKEYCSGVCCAYTVKLAHLARKKLDGNVKIYDIFSDWCLPGKGNQEFYNRFASEGTEYIRVDNPNAVQIHSEKQGVSVQCGKNSVIADMVVLAPAIVPSEDSKELSSLLGLCPDKDGFYTAEHEKISPASTATRGIYIAGAVSGPKDISQSVLQAQAAAGMALHAIVPGEKIELEAATAKVEADYCGGCRVCIPLCPYQAISRDEEKKVAVINEILCRGCGVCVSACPAGAIINKNFTTEEIFSGN